jgi:radical SAM protein with 4Fe4S-binding SPASM domain
MKIHGAWLTTNRECNLRCPWCYGKGTQYFAKEEMELNLAKKLSKICKELGMRDIILIGGEPTLWKPLFEFNQFCGEEDISTTLVTNGLRFADDRFFAQYQKHPCRYLSFSVKGLLNQYRLFKSSISVRNTKKAFSRIANNYTKTASFVFSTFNRENLLDVAKFIAECGFRTLTISFCTPSFAGLDISGEFMIHPQELVDIILRNHLEMSRYIKVYFNMSLPLCIWPKKFLKKITMSTSCQVRRGGGALFDTNGDSIMCNGLFDYPIAKYGKDFCDAKSYLRFRERKSIKHLYDKIINFPSLKCRDCEKYIECGGGCPLLWFFYKPDDIIKGIPV